MKIRATTFQTRTDTNTQDITISGFGTPDAVFFIFNGENTTAPGTTNDAILGMGATDGTTEWAFSVTDENGLGTTSTSRVSDEDWCLKITEDLASVTTAAATFDSWITDGVRIDWNYNTLGTGVYVTAILFQCDGAKVGYASLVSNPTSISGVGFEADIVLMGSIGLAQLDNSATNSILSLGFGANGGNQRCLAQSSITAVGTSVVTSQIFTDSIVSQIFNDAVSWKAAIENFGSDGFDINTLSGSSGNDYVFYLALDLGTAQKWVGTVDSPTTTGDDSQTGPDFEPDCVIQLLSMCQSVDTLETDADAGSYGISVIDTDGTDLCHSITIEDNVGTTNTESTYDTDAIDLNTDDGSVAFDATYSSMDSNGWTLNFSSVNGTTRKWAALAIGQAGGDSILLPIIINANLHGNKQVLSGGLL